ncbi:hypothetical protein [Marinobacter salexigens]|uniref:hypothetical protein n=1 Tax=Marinobacter salexigens TaxID=1925763 RepID=UPI000C2892EA|nr:hypothetical protein [Marinobacter salexigens]
MVALTRFGSSRGFILETTSLDPNLLTLYVPSADPDVDRIPNLRAALQESANFHDQSFFLQLVKIGKDSGRLEGEINAAIAHVQGDSGKYAFLLWNHNDGRPALWLRRDAEWKQTAGTTILRHLATSEITTYRDSLITVGELPEPSLVFKGVEILLAGRHLVYHAKERDFATIDFFLDLRRGVFRFEGFAEVDLFADRVISQAFFCGDYVEGNPYSRPFGLRSRRDLVQIFDQDKIGALYGAAAGLGFLVRGEWDVFPYDKISWDLRRSSREIQKRSKIELIEPVGTEKSHIDLPVNQHDTLGNSICLQVGKPGQSLRFVRAPQQLFHDRGNLDVGAPSWGVAGSGSVIMLEGEFPISPLSGGGRETVRTQARRLKLGVSNTEVVSVEERGVPVAALHFIGEATDKGSASIASANEQPAFMRRSILHFSKELELEPEEVEDFKTGELLSASVPTIWAHIVPVSPDGRLIGQGQAATEQGWRVSSQADEMAQFGPDQNLSIANASKTLDYQLDDEPDAALAARKVLFVSGADASARSGGSFKNGSPAPRIEDPVVLLNETLSRYRLQQRTKDKQRITEIRGAQGVAVTPQGFELDRQSGKEVVSLAKSVNVKNEEKKFSLKFRDSGFRSLMRQNQFFLVVPAKYADISTGMDGSELFDLDQEIQISDWGFSLDLASDPGGVSALSSNASRDPILVAKYKKGTLRNLLNDEETWDNYSQESRFPSDKLASTKATIRNWIAEVDESAPSIGINDTQGKVDYYRYIRRILDAPDWVGTLLIYPQVDLDNMPEGLAGLASGMKLDRFRAHHVGFNQNKITQVKGLPSMRPSSFFGLVSYSDDSSLEQNFSFKVPELKVLFGNSEVKGFDCLLKVKLAEWFGEESTFNNGGAVPKGLQTTGNKAQTLWIRGRYESLITNGQKINTYSFIHDRPIYLIDRPDEDYENNDGRFFQELTISKLEFKTHKVEDQSGGKRKVSSKIVIDADAKFKKLSLAGISDILNFESIEMNGLSLDFDGLFEKSKDGTWSGGILAWPKDLNFDAIAIDANFPKLRKNGLLANFPLKFERFHLFKGLSLPEVGYSNFGNDKQGKINFGLQFRLDLGSLGRLIGFDSSLVADLMVGWKSGDDPGFAVGLRFPDNGGRRLDMSIGPVKFTAGYFDMFEGDEGSSRFIALTDFRMDINGFKLPPEGVTSGILLTPATGQNSEELNQQSNEGANRSYLESMGWLAGFTAEKVAFFEKFGLFVSQNFRYTGLKQTAKDVYKDVEEIIKLKLGERKEGESDSEYRKRIKAEVREYRGNINTRLRYDTNSEWFIGAGAEFPDKFITAHAVYNPPKLYGGEASVKDLASLSVMYQQTTPRLGVYTATLKFAEEIRRFSVGAVTIQLPWVVMKMDTDGGYLVNVGLNLDDLTDYSNAGAAEFGVFTGSAGVAYGKISGSALRDVPLLRKTKSGAKTALPVYTPVTRLTLSGKFGIGRSLDEWPMFHGGAHVSVYGILSGTWGKFNTIELKGRVDEKKIEEISRALRPHYHKYWAELGILAEIWGVIDFSVTRFGVNARALIAYGVVFETLRGTTAYARALIQVSIRWVLFRIKVFGRKIEVAIRLKFEREFRKTYVLARPKSDISYDEYFVTTGGAQGLRALNATEAEDLGSVDSVTFDPDQSPPDSPQKTVEVLPQFDYVRNDTGNIVAVPVLNLLYGEPPESDDPDTGSFKNLLEFIVDWSFNSLKINELLSDGSDQFQSGKISKAKVKACAEAVAALRMPGDRGEWSASNAKAHLTTAFRFDYLNPETLPEEFEEEPRGATVFFTPQEMKAFRIAENDVETPIPSFANRSVPSTFVEDLDKLFDFRRIQVREGDEFPGTNSVREGATSLLEDYLFEEYLESILKAAWAILSEKLPGLEMPDGITLPELKRKMLSLASGVSMRVNQQFFSGNRVPEYAMDLPEGKELTDPDQSTKALPSARLIEIGIDPDALPKALVLTFDQSRIVFKTDEDAAGQIRDLLKQPVDFGKIEPGRKLPFVKGPKEALPLTEKVSIEGKGINLHILPDVLKTKTNYFLDRYQPKERDKGMPRESLPFKQVVLIKIPLLPVDGAQDLYQIDRMPEDSRRALGLIHKAQGAEEVDFGNPDMGYTFLRNVGDNNDAFDEINCNMEQSFILRTNLSTDPNPTDIPTPRLFEQSEPDIMVRKFFSQRERQKALSILADAAETNSGGYMLRLKGFEESEKQEITMMIVLPELRETSPLPLYVQAINAGVTVSAEAPLMLREVGEKVVALGAPGVLELEVKRPNPENRFKSLNLPGLRVSRAEALRERLESVGVMKVANNSAVFEQFQYSNAAERLLEAAGGKEVNLSARYNLLAVSIEGNEFYEGRPAELDLPVTPVVDEVDSDKWAYSWSVSAARLVKPNQAQSRDLVRDPDHHFVYGAIGTKMKVKTQFRDIMGYNAPGGEQTADLIPLYYDPLLAPGALAGMTSSHDVANKKLVYSLTFDGSQLVSLADQGGLSLSAEEARQNLKNRAADIMRCMQQMRDTGTHYDLFCTLGFTGGENKRLSASDRKRVYSFLKRCYQAVRDGATNFTDRVELEFSLSGKPPAEGFALYRTELVISRNANEVHDGLQGDDNTANLKKSEVLEKRIELPLTDEPDTHDKVGRSKEERLAEAVTAFTSRGGRPKIVAAHTEDARGRTLIYILDAKILELTPSRAAAAEPAAYAAFEPLATQTRSEAEADFWDWLEKKRGPKANEIFGKVTISNFDMDTAFRGLLNEIDFYNAPDQCAVLLRNNESVMAGLVEDLARARAQLADSLAKRHEPIYQDDEDAAEIHAAKKVLEDNLSNSLKRRISRFYGLDTILVVPLAYERLPKGAENSFCLYGSVKHSAQEGNFLPAAIRRSGTNGHLCIQFDVANAGASRSVNSSLSFNIEYVRVNLGEGDVGSIDPDDTRWLKLFTPTRIPLAQDKPANIPVLFKSLVIPPSVSVLDSSELEGDSAKSLKTWSLVIDVERKDQVAQDDTYLDVDYNTRPDEIKAALNTKRRSALSVLYEFSELSGKRNSESGGVEVDDGLWIEALAYWAKTLAELLVPLKVSPASQLENPAEVHQSYLLSTKNDKPDVADRKSTTLLMKKGEWKRGRLDFKLERINLNKGIDNDARSDNRGGGLARVISEYDPEMRYQGNRITIRGLSLMLLENAWPRVWVKRNQNLGESYGLKTNKKFTYSSSEVRTSDRYTPSILVEEPVSISGSTLGDALLKFMKERLFDDLIRQDLREDSKLWPTMDLLWSYESGVLDALKVKHPELGLFKPEPIARSTAIQTGGNLKPIADAVDASVNAWLQKNPQAANRGRIELRMTIFSRLLKTEKQLLRIEKIQFSL